MQKKTMQGNRQPSYEFDEREKNLYHIRFNEELTTKVPGATVKTEKVQKFTEHGFADYVKNKNHFSFNSEVILHDPTFIQQPKPDVKGEPGETKSVEVIEQLKVPKIKTQSIKKKSNSKTKRK